MNRRIFMPGKGARPARYTAALCTNTDVYRGDLVIWDHEATPTAITWEGQTLTALDMVFVDTDATAADKIGSCAGLIEGKRVGDLDTTTAIASATTGAVAIVQTWGVFASHANTEDATVVAGALLLSTSTIAGEMVDATTATDDGTIVGVALSADATYTRGTVTTNTGVTAFVRCDW
jgi:hypothetical protein